MIGSCCWSTWKSKEALLIAIERNKDIGFKAIGNDELFEECIRRNSIMQECLRKFRNQNITEEDLK